MNLPSSSNSISRATRSTVSESRRSTSMAVKPDEPWLRGPVKGVHPLLGATLHAYMQTEEDLAQWTAGFTGAQIWSRRHGLAAVGFQLRHIARSVDRLTTYLSGE